LDWYLKGPPGRYKVSILIKDLGAGGEILKVSK